MTLKIQSTPRLLSDKKRITPPLNVFLNNPMLSIEHLSASVEKKKILRDISYSFEAGKTYALLGPNGSGKSTLASVIMGHPNFTLSRASKLLWNGKNIKNLSPDKRALFSVSA
jgi:Fe-S cluster assembly ATP-binding protein